MTTPTKEQISKLYMQGAGSFACDEIADVCYLTPMQIKDVIVKWEKIRNSHK